MFRLDGKVALVTGGTKGIGRAIALSFAEAGAKVCVNYSSDETSASDTVEKLKEISGWGISVKASVSDPDAVAKMVETVVDEAGVLNILVNNAGIIRDSLLMLMRDEDWKAVIETNLFGVYNCSKAVLRPMIGEKWGRIINIISPSALMGRAGQTNYASSKGGILSFTRSLAREVARLGITVNALSPGVIDTELTSELPDKVKQELLGMIPLKRFGSPDEISAAACFLASGESGYITGEIISVDGGLT